MSTERESARLLVVDDEESIVEFVRMGLTYEGFEVHSAGSGSEGLRLFGDLSPQLVVLDIQLPDFDGFEVCRRLRALSNVPILMLTARGDLEDRVRGLEIGADDYLAKPFKFPELLARVRALLRRAGAAGGNVLRFADIALDLSTRRVTRAGKPVELTLREFELLELLMRRPHHVFSRDHILEQLWGFDFTGDSKVVEVHVSALRAKLADTERRIIRTVRGVGYAVGG